MVVGTLRRRASKASAARGHRLRWLKPFYSRRMVPSASNLARNAKYGDSLRVVLTGDCIRCGAWAQVDTRPPANGVEVGGPAVAVNCLGVKR